MKPFIQRYWGGLPVLILGGMLYTVEYYGHMRMGMMRYLVFANRQLEGGLLQPAFLPPLTGIMLILFAGSVYRSFRCFRDSTPGDFGRVFAVAIASGFGAGWLLLPVTRQFLAFHFGSVGIMVLTAVLLFVTAVFRVIGSFRSPS